VLVSATIDGVDPSDQSYMNAASPFTEISVEELSQKLSTDEGKVQFIDVREPQEIEVASLDRFANYPLSQSRQWSDNIASELDPHAETIVICHHGMRSAQMCQWLASQGFSNVKNVVGGIDAYAIAVDANVPRY